MSGRIATKTPNETSQLLSYSPSKQKFVDDNEIKDKYVYNLLFFNFPTFFPNLESIVSDYKLRFRTAVFKKKFPGIPYFLYCTRVSIHISRPLEFKLQINLEGSFALENIPCLLCF